MKKTASITFWQPISSFGANSLADSPSTLYFNNAELNEILSKTMTLGLSNCVIVDKYGKSNGQLSPTGQVEFYEVEFKNGEISSVSA